MRAPAQGNVMPVDVAKVRLERDHRPGAAFDPRRRHDLARVQEAPSQVRVGGPVVDADDAIARRRQALHESGGVVDGGDHTWRGPASDAAARYHRAVTLIALAGIAAAVISLIDPVPYIRDILRGATRPHRGTWLIWSALGATAFASQLAERRDLEPGAGRRADGHDGAHPGPLDPVRDGRRVGGAALILHRRRSMRAETAQTAEAPGAG